MAFALTLLALAGCGDEGAGDGGTGASLSPADYCVTRLTAACERQIGCNVALLNQATSITSCVDDARRTCEPLLQGWIDSVEARRARFDGAALAGCRDGYGAASCKALAAGLTPPACDEVFTGDAGLGADCYTDVECAGALVCATAGQCPGACAEPTTPPSTPDCRLIGCPDDQWCQGSACRPRAVEGTRCQEEDQCEAGLFCGKDVNAPELLCRRQKAANGICFSRAYCAEGLACLGGQPGERTCGPAVQSGDFCRDTEECEPGLICQPGLGTCGPPQPEEQICLTNADCEPGLYCWLDFPDDTPSDGLCREPGKVGIAEGELCNPPLDRCRLGLYCRIGDDSPEVGACTLLPTLDEPCQSFGRNLNGECRDGVCIDLGAEATCRELREPGEPCGNRQECISNACVDGACAPFEDVLCTSAPGG